MFVQCTTAKLPPWCYFFIGILSLVNNFGPCKWYLILLITLTIYMFQVPRAMSLERFPKVYETDLHVLRFSGLIWKRSIFFYLLEPTKQLGFQNWYFWMSWKLCRSDLVQILDQKTFYIPNFHLFVGGERGFRFQVHIYEI